MFRELQIWVANSHMVKSNERSIKATPLKAADSPVSPYYSLIDFSLPPPIPNVGKRERPIVIFSGGAARDPIFLFLCPSPNSFSCCIYGESGVGVDPSARR